MVPLRAIQTPPSLMKEIIVVGGGVFGLTASISLRARGHRVKCIEYSGWPSIDTKDSTLMDPKGPYRGSSVDISRIVRADYGDSLVYVDMMEEGFPKWREWNKEFGEDVYHETGFLLMAKEPKVEGKEEDLSHETKSYRELFTNRGWPIRSINNYEELHSKFPAWCGSLWEDESVKDTRGYLNSIGGFAHNGRTIAHLARKAVKEGVVLITGDVKKVETGLVTLENNVTFTCDEIVIATGAFTEKLLPEVKDRFVSVAQSIFYIEPKKEVQPLFESHIFPCFSADTSVGYYGFTSHSGVVKIARHGYGQKRAADTTREVLDKECIEHFNQWLPTCFPALVGSPYKTRVCFYCDTHDGNFYICPVPHREGITLASGGSGHGFKFAPVLGEIIADVVEKKHNKYAHAFEWRDPKILVPHADTMRSREFALDEMKSKL